MKFEVEATAYTFMCQDVWVFYNDESEIFYEDKPWSEIALDDQRPAICLEESLWICGAEDEEVSVNEPRYGASLFTSELLKDLGKGFSEAGSMWGSG